MVRLELSNEKSKTEYGVKCPRCGSTNVHVDRKGYDWGSGFFGGICLGPIGLLCGGMDSNRLMAQCLNCGKTFNITSGLGSKWAKDNAPHNKDIECPYCNKDFRIDLKTVSKNDILKCPHCNKQVKLSDEDVEDKSIEEDEESKDIKYCKECGQKTRKNTKFCKNCGAKLK